jgi:predicted membrane protein
MKMNGLFFGGLFWGILISLIGLSIILKYAFNIDLHMIRLFFGIIIVLLGLRIVIGQTGNHHSATIKTQGYHHYDGECNVVFSSRTIDLTRIPENGKLPGEISVVFGSATVILPDSMNLEVSSTTVFGTTILPDRSYAGFGEDRYTIRNNPTAPLQKIETNTVFGKLVFEVVPTVPNEIKPDSTDTQPENDY